MECTQEAPIEHPPNQIAQQLRSFDDQLSRASEVQTQLDNRLAIVSRDEPETPTDHTGHPEETLTPLANELRSYIRRLREITDEYESIIHRLEL